MLRQLSDEGYRIRIITHRLVTNWGHARIVSDTVEWLDTNRIPYRDLCFLGAKPEAQAVAVRGDTIVAVGTRKARAISSVVRPPSSCKVSAARASVESSG